MSNISTVTDTIIQRLGYIYSSNTSYTRIPDPYELPNNKEIFLRKGYGLKYNGASKEESEFNQYVFNHSFSVVLTRENIKLESDTTPLDDVTQVLLEDVYRLQQDFYSSSELGIQGNIRLVDLAEVSGVTTVSTENDKFKTIEINIDFMICESY